jgi:P4 family phage/plasmid primase-like protien
MVLRLTAKYLSDIEVFMGEVDPAANGRLGKGALWYANKGWKVLPVHGVVNGKCTCGQTHLDGKEVGKHPAIKGWQDEASSDVDKVAKWWESNPDYNIGVYCKDSSFLVIDIDPRNGGDDSFLKLEERASGNLPPTVEAITGVWSDKGRPARGRHLIYKCSPNEKFIGNFKKAGLDGIDVKHNGYILIAPSRHFSGVNYTWKPGHAPWEMEIAEAPEELLAVIRAGSPRTGSGRNTSYYKDGIWESFQDLEFGGEKIDIDKIMQEGIDEGHRAVEIYRLACALANKMGTDPVSRSAIESLMIRFNHESVRPPMELEGPNSLLMHVNRAIDFVGDNPKVNLKWNNLSSWVETRGMEWAEKSQAETDAKINNSQKPASYVGTHASSEPSQTVVIHDADSVSPSVGPDFVGDRVSKLVKTGMSVAQAIGGGNMDLPDDQDAIDAEDGGVLGARSLTDVGNSRRLVDTFGSAIRYTPGLGWFYWDGNYWKPDIESLELQELAKRIAPVIASEVANYDLSDPKVNEIINWAKQAKSNTRINNMIKSAVSDKRTLVGVSQWDGDSSLLGVMNGVVDLRSGELLSGRPDLYITRRAPVAYTPGLRNVRFEQFLDFATNGDKEFQEWLQRAVGYTLTGLNNQDALFLVYGPPGSGKTTFVETIVNALGTQQYSWTLDSSVLAAGDGNANRTDEYHMAELRGRRMIWVDELPESERLKENQVKKMTGSGTLSGRSPGERPFTFVSQGKLWVTTNHRPIITDDAMWRRLRPIPLTSIPENPDRSLRPYLSDPEGGLPAVLSWAVEGAIKYLNSSAKDPLGWCSVVKEAADIYRKNEDRIGLFFEEETKEVPGAVTSITDLFTRYRKWSDYRGERPLTQIAFHRKISDRGMKLIGQGAKAELHDYSLTLQVVSEPKDINWANEMRFYN